MACRPVDPQDLSVAVFRHPGSESQLSLVEDPAVDAFGVLFDQLRSPVETLKLVRSCHALVAIVEADVDRIGLAAGHS